jgi:2-polyprenyl-3-methyl-5-hydroxy-6-metoxy-1,4-benzoquinol methylase
MKKNMKIQLIETYEVEIIERFTFSEVAKVCELNDQEMQELIDYGAINAEDSDKNNFLYSAQNLKNLQSACKQRRDYDLDLFSVVICVQYLEHIADLERQIESLQAVSPK